MHLALFHLIEIAKIYQKLMGLVKWHHHVAEMVHESAELVEDQALEADRFFVELGLFGLHESLHLSIQLANALLEHRTAGADHGLGLAESVLVILLRVHFLGFSHTESGTSPSLHSCLGFEDFLLDLLLDAITPAASVLPDAVVDQEEAEQLFPCLFLIVNVRSRLKNGTKQLWV